MGRTVPLVLPAAFSAVFRAASAIDVRVVLTVRQLVEGYKSIDRVIIATRDGFFLCNGATGEFTRYVRWEIVQTAHWYSALQVAAFVCEDGLDVVVVSSSSGGGANNTNTSATPSSPPVSPRMGRQASVSSFPASALASQPPAGSSFSSAPAAATKPPQTAPSGGRGALRSIVQRVRSSTLNFGKRAPPVVPVVEVSPLPVVGAFGTSPLSSSSVTLADDIGLADPSHVSDRAESEQAPPICSSVVVVGDRVSPYPTYGGSLPISSTSPTSLSEFVEWAAALSQSRAYHGVSRTSFAIVRKSVEHLNAWQTYRVKIPAGLTMEPPCAVMPSEHLHASEDDLARAKAWRHEDDVHSAGELRRAALMLGGVGKVEDLLAKRKQGVEQDGIRSPLQQRHNDCCPPTPCAALPEVLTAALGPSVAALSSDEQGEPETRELVTPPSSTLGRRQTSRRDSSDNSDDPVEADDDDEFRPRRRGLTLFSMDGHCSVGGRGMQCAPSTASLRGAAVVASSVAAPRLGARASLTGEEDAAGGGTDDDEFVVIDNPGARVWRASPSHELTPEEQCEWWRQHCAALVLENKCLRQESHELRVQLSHAQFDSSTAAAQLRTGLGASYYHSAESAAAALRRHRLPF